MGSLCTPGWPKLTVLLCLQGWPQTHKNLPAFSASVLISNVQLHWTLYLVFVFMPDLSLNLVFTVSTRLPVEMLLSTPSQCWNYRQGCHAQNFFFFNLENLYLKYLCLCTKHFTNRAISLGPMLRDLQSLLDYCGLEK